MDQVDQDYCLQKQSFIESQIEILTQEFHPSKKWISENKFAEEPLNMSIVNNAVNKLNNSNRIENKRIFNRHTIRQVIEQLSIIRRQKLKDLLDGRINVEIKPNYDNIKWIESFPEEWPPQLEEFDEEKLEKLDEYEEKRSLVYNVQTNYIAMKEKYEYYKNLHKLMEPLNNSNHIQQNLITRNSPVIDEISKMRILCK
ncbi:3511_t:CDS:2 [Diversispora eburnea]|uniref:3511_t:CDS:1 n=1 Tax=Diversispora eburnea TaxID=1213867 RepID=A0A9N9G9L3_9GLOM|nr:3511_t:CDS:2 [Diversispora eburnea]